MSAGILLSKDLMVVADDLQFVPKFSVVSLGGLLNSFWVNDVWVFITLWSLFDQF